jgi:hypothetical protein
MDLRGLSRIALLFFSYYYYAIWEKGDNTERIAEEKIYPSGLPLVDCFTQKGPTSDLHHKKNKI